MPSAEGIAPITFDKASEQLRAQSRVLQTLFPGVDVEKLAAKSQDELLGLLRLGELHHGQHHDAQSALPEPEPIQDEIVGLPNSSGAEDSAPISENGEPVDERKWDESLDEPVPVAIDDINAIGLATDEHARSYLGVTSMSATLRAIFRLCPAAKEHTAQCARALVATPAPAPATQPVLGRDPALSILREQRCIDFYFEYIHPITPLLDEQDFRSQHASGSRQDGSWMGLLNMVCALGSIASGSEGLHEQYYRQARSFTGLDSLGSGNMDSLQALCLLGGYYLHYRNSPNMAYSILGAAHRVAIALGLHREPKRATNNVVEFILPGYVGVLGPDDHAANLLQANTRLCLICERLQQRFAQFGRPSNQEILSLDAQLQDWFGDLPESLKSAENSPPQYQFARELMKTRYFNARIILARSLILYIAHDCKRKLKELMPEQRHMLNMSCQVATEAIDSTARYWMPNRIQVWNMAWYLFQACSVPLLCIAIEKNLQHSSLPPNENVDVWKSSLAKALETFTEMRPWMRASDRSPDIVSAIYEAIIATEADGTMRTPSATDGSIDMFGWCDEQLTEMDWGVFLGDESLTRGMFPI
ncbi:C6 transcription factor [Purpureocillium lavendulum]|uniref:C6 transcription factor n=1 Tax=Purpureocillium lavendulum TaxID=1247861 RepID=A0AB34G6L7_9HYPO|nr:C6 transcription factor [Purpureocillium lavendulum]